MKDLGFLDPKGEFSDWFPLVISEENIKNKIFSKARAINYRRYNDGEILVHWRSNWLMK